MQGIFQAPVIRQRTLCQEIICPFLCSSTRELRAWLPPSRTVSCTTCSTQPRIGPPRHGWPSFFLFCTSLAATTVKTYQSGINRFQKYCQCNHYVCCPVSEVVLCGFVSTLADEGLKHRSIKTYCTCTYLSGVRYHQIKSGYTDPFQGPAMPRLEFVMKGVKHHQAKAGVGGFLSRQNCSVE